MTKPRPPLSIEQAILRVIGLIGWDGAGAATGFKESAIRKWSDPDSDNGISFESAIRLDVAYRAAGGEGAPLYQLYSLRAEIDLRASSVNCDEIAAAAGRAARESGEAVQALFDASRPGASPDALAVARREVEEATGAFTVTLSKLGAGPGGHIVDAGDA